MKAKIKICPSCEAECGQKTKTCKECGHKFSFEKKKKFEEIKKWKELKRGDVFHLIKGSGGPYYINDFSERFDMFERGRFTVLKIYEKGISASSSEGLVFFYMGEKYKCPITGLIKRPYKVYKKIN